MKKISFAVATLLLLNSKSFAQTSTDNSKKWGIETELVQPLLPNVGIIRIQATRTLTSPAKKNKGDLIFGAYLRPNVKHDVVEKINEYMLILGYRQYFWKGLHLEAKMNSGYAWGTRNLIDGKDYETSTFFYESNLGYKLDFAKKKNSNFYAIAQFGVIGNAKGNNTVNIGPRGGKADVFPQGNLIIGVNF
jgi:hypothetical protein